VRDTLNPIRTTFNGIVYRSRLESNVAQMLYQLEIAYEYEPSSFLLDDGTHYRPDFWCPEIRLWIEVRGYSNQKGDRQIRQFGNATLAGRLRADKMLLPDASPSPLRVCGHPRSEGCPDDCVVGDTEWRGSADVDYLVLSPGNDSRFFEVPSYHTDEGRDTEVIVCVCTCGKAYFASAHNDWRCRVCGASDKRYHLKEWDRIYLDEFGRPTVLHEWYDRGRGRLLSHEMDVPTWLSLVRAMP
jgi:hypothetical protein